MPGVRRLVARSMIWGNDRVKTGIGTEGPKKISVGVLCWLCAIVGNCEDEASAQIQRELAAMRQIEADSKTWVEAADRCRSATDRLLDDPRHRVEAEFMAAKVAMLRGESRAAILVLDEIIRGRRNDKCPSLNISADIAGLLWKGTVARHSGDLKAARDVYKEVIRRRPEARRPGGGYLDIVCRMYLAEIAYASDRGAGEVAKILTEARSVWTPEEKQWKSVHSFYVKWLGYWVAAMNGGSEAAQRDLVCTSEGLALRPLIAAHHLEVVGITGEPRVLFWDGNDLLYLKSLRMATENVASKMDRDLALLFAGFLHQSRNGLIQACDHYKRLYESDSFFAPDAGIFLLRILRKRGEKAAVSGVLERIATRFPGYKRLANEE